MAKSILRAGKIVGVVIVAIIFVAVVLYSAGVLSIAQTQLPPPETTILPEFSPVEPTSDVTLGEQKELVTACLAGDDPGATVAAMDTLLTDFAEHEQLPVTVHEIVQKAVKAGKYEAVSEVCRALAENPSVANNGVWVAMASALAAVYQGDDAALGAATGHLTANFSGDLRSIEVFREIAYSFRQRKKYAKARQSYQHVVDTWPNGPGVVFSQRGLVMANLELGDTAAASAELDNLLTDYAQDPDLVECAETVARTYRDKKQFDTAIGIYEFIAENRADDPQAIRSQLELFNIALVNLKDDARADAAYATLVERFGGHDGIAKAVGEVAWAYRKQKRYADSLRVYQEVLANWPDSESALIARRGIVLSLIGLADAEGADAEAAGLLADFEGAEGVTGAALKLADEFSRKKLYESARRLYEYAADNRSDGKQAIVIQRKVVTTNIDLGDEDGASAALEALRAGFAGDKQLADQVYEVGECYRSRKKYDHARGVYQSVIEDWPGTAKAMWSGQRCIVMDIDLSLSTEDPNHPSSEIPADIMQAIDDLIVDCNDIPALAQAVFYLGEEYYLRVRSREGDLLRDTHRYDNAIRIWEIAINDTAYEKTYTPFAYYLAAHCCEKAEQYDKAITYYKKLTQDGYRHAKYSHRAPLQLGYIYKYKKKNFQEAAYWFNQQNILFDKDGGVYGQKFVCDRAMFALGVVYRLDLKDYDKAIDVYETYLHEFPQSRRAELTPLVIAQCYAAKGDTAKAIGIIQGILEENPNVRCAADHLRILNELQKGGE